MKLKLTLLILIFSTFFVFSQHEGSDEEWYKMLEAKEVFINKKIIAYSYAIFRTKNGIETSDLNTPNVNNPFNIFISTNENNATIRINNRNEREDLLYKFRKIYRYSSDNKVMYDFLDSHGCEATYTIPSDKSKHHNLLISCGQDKNNKQVIIFTISKFDQL